MGAGTSKVTRRLPTRPGALTPPSIPAAGSGRRQAASEKPLASETKSQGERTPMRNADVGFEDLSAIEADGRDPQFMSRLGMLGPVRVDHRRPEQPVTPVRPAADMEQMFRDRTQASTASQRGGERQGGQNGMLATTLSDLLEERKGAMTVFELESLATRYKTDVHTIERVCRHFNTPSVDERTAVRKRDERGDEVVVVAARWVDPPLKTR